MGLGACGACVVEAGLGAGVVTAAGEAGARYLSMAGSTSGVPWKRVDIDNVMQSVV